MTARARIGSLVVLALAWLGAAGAHASPLVDPFLERFRVGSYQDPGRLALEAGWPRDLFLPCHVDSLWLAAAESVLVGRGLVAHAPAGSLLVVALGDDVEGEAWLREREARLRRLLSPAGPDTLPAPTAGWLSKEILQATALYDYNNTNYGIATIGAERLASAGAALDLAPEERFVWSLRARRLRELASGAPAPPDTVPWPDMLDLGPHDGASAWALWVARQRALARPLLPPGSGTVALARFLVRLPRAWLAAPDLEAAGFPEEALAAVGAACLERGTPLAAHLRRHPRPPADSRFQDAWVRGQMRAVGWAPGRAESLATHEGLLPAQRARLWRRASEERLMEGNWAAGRADLRSAFAAVAGPGREAERTVVAEWARQAMALAWVRDRRADAERIRDDVAGFLAPAELAAWEERAAPLRARLAGEEPAATAWIDEDRLATAGRRVRAGLAGGLTPPGEPARWPEAAAAWQAWCAWGEALAAGRSVRLADTRAAEYRDAIAAAGVAATPAAGGQRAVAALGRFFSGHPLRGPALDWLLSHAIRAQAGPDAAFAPAAPALSFGGVRDWPDRHALLGLALAADDPHAVVVAARDLPAAGVPFDVRSVFLYPVPRDGELRRRLEGSGVDPALLLAIARNESLFDPGARSAAGALGWLQIMPFHYPERGAPGGSAIWRRPGESLATGARLLREAAAGFGADAYRTLAGYNAGLGAARRWSGQLAGRVEPDLFLTWIGYAETRAYVEKVLIDREIYGWILAGRPAGAP